MKLNFAQLENLATLISGAGQRKFDAAMEDLYRVIHASKEEAFTEAIAIAKAENAEEVARLLLVLAQHERALVLRPK